MLGAVVLAVFGFTLATTGSSRAASAAGLGVYRGAATPSGVGAFGIWAGRSPTYALDFLAGTSWSSIESPNWWLDGWASSSYNVVYSVPLIPDTGGSIQEGATGAYNSHFVKLAQTLVSKGKTNATLRLGWEFNGNWYRWAAAPNPAGFAQYWRQIVTAMRTVAPGLRFDWNPTLGANAMSSTGVEAAYPGDAYVDFIGTDVYDQSWGGPNGSLVADPAARWSTYLSQRNGLNWVASFAAAHGKPITIPEWGLSVRTDGHGGGDNAYFIDRMYNWISSNNVAYHMYFEFDASDGRHRLMTGQFPLGAAAFRSHFGGLPVSTASSTVSSPSSSSPTSIPGPTTTTTTTTSTTTPTTTTTPPATSTTSPASTTTTPTTSPAPPASAQPEGAGRALNASAGACKEWRTTSRPPRWFWTWARWRLGHAEFKGHRGVPAYRPTTVPRVVPRSIWKQYRRLLRGERVAGRVCVRR